MVLDGSSLASGLAFCGDNGPCLGSGATSYSDLLFDTFGGQHSDAGYLDNVLVQSTPGVPEPSTWALSILGFAALGGALRRAQAGRRVVA